MCFLLVLFSRFLIGHTEKVILSKQDDILIQMRVGRVKSNDSHQVCIALKWLKPRGKCSGGPFLQHILRTASLYLDWTC